MLKTLLTLGMIGHIICAVTDILITFAKDGNKIISVTEG